MLLRHLATLTAAASLAVASGAGCGAGEEAEPVDRFDAARAFADIAAQVEIGPRHSGSPGSRREVGFIVHELRRAEAEDIAVQRPWRNVVATLRGREAGAVVVGAHHDTKDGIPGFVGANDGGSGVAVVLELARSLPRPLPGPSVHLVLMDAEEARGARAFEEDGTRGSRQYVEYARRGVQGSPPLGDIRAMVLFDMVGDCDLEVPLEGNSDAELYRRFAEAATQVSGGADPFTGEAAAVADDHLPFAEAGVPALDLIDFAYGPGAPPGEYWHTPEDTLDKVCESSLDAVGEAAVVAIPRIR